MAGVAVMSEARSTSETRSSKGAATRDQILNAAARLIHVQGYQSTSLDDVLRESGVGKGNFYYYFKSKEDLGYAIIDRITQAFVERSLGPAFADTDADPVTQIHAFLDRVLDAQRLRKCVGGCVMGNLASELSDVHEGFRLRLASIFDLWRVHLAEAVSRGQARGRLRADVDASRVAQFLVAGPRGLDPAQQGHQGHHGHGEMRRGAEAAPHALWDMSMSTVHAQNGHEQDTGAPRKVDRDAELVERLRRQEPGAPEALVETYGDRVSRLAIRITGNEQDAEEVVQDALWTAARKIDTFKGESAFGSWVYRITANAAYQKLRSRQGQRNEISWDAMSPGFDELGQHAEPLRDWSARTEEPALQTELRSLLTTAIDDLPGDYKTAFSSTTSRGSRTRRSRRRSTSACPR